MIYNDLQRLLTVEKEYYTVKETAHKLSVHWQTILNCIKRGELEAVKVGRGYRVDKKALKKFLVSRTTKRAV